MRSPGRLRVPAKTCVMYVKEIGSLSTPWLVAATANYAGVREFNFAPKDLNSGSVETGAARTTSFCRKRTYIPFQARCRLTKLRCWIWKFTTQYENVGSILVIPFLSSGRVP